MQEVDVFILAAGFGTRLRPLTDSLPKALVSVGGKTLLERHLERLQSQGFSRVIINLHFEAQQIRDFVGDGSQWGLEVVFSEESEILDTGGGIKNIEAHLKHSALLTINSDSLFEEINLREVIATHFNNSANPLATMVLREDSNVADYGSIGVDKEDRVVEFLGAGDAASVTKQLMFTGVQVLSREAVAEMPEATKAYSVTGDFLKPAVVSGKPIYSHLFSGKWFDVGTHERLNAAETALGSS